MAEPVPTLRLGNLTFHLPFADLIRPHTHKERVELETSIRAHKKILVRVVTYDSPTWGERCVIDGLGRLTVAAALGYDVPVQHRGALSDADARAERVALNIDRRQLTPDEQTVARAKRLERIVAAHNEGRTSREIARAEGVSQTQVMRDLANRTDGSAEPPVSHDGLNNPRANRTDVSPEPPVSHADLNDPTRPLAVLERATHQLVRAVKAPGSAAALTGAVPELLAGPLRPALERIAARHGAPLDGDRWPLVDTLRAVVADLVAEAEQPDRR